MYFIRDPFVMLVFKILFIFTCSLCFGSDRRPARVDIHMELFAGGKTKTDMPAFGTNIILSFSKIPPANFQSLPGADVRYSKITFEDDIKSSFICGVSKSISALDENMYDLFFIDIDPDQIISSQEILKGEYKHYEDGRVRCYYGSVYLPLQYNGQTRKYWICFSWNSWPRHGFFYGQSHCYTKGKALLNGKSIVAILIDHNLDGRFNTSSRSMCDYVWFDLNNDNEVQHWKETAYIDGFFVINHLWFSVTSSAAGDRVSLTPYSGGLGKLQLPFDKCLLGLQSSDSKMNLTLDKNDVFMPEDTYAINTYSIQIKKPDGEWKLRGSSGGADKPMKTGVKIVSGEITNIKMGPPLAGKMELKIDERSGCVIFKWMAVGVGGEHVSATGAVGACPLPPKITIQNNQKEIVHSTSMSGGCGGEAVYYWTPNPELTPGQYRADAVCDSWPLPVKRSSCSFELGSFHKEKQGEKIAEYLNTEEQDILKALVELKEAAKVRFPDVECEAVFYNILSEKQVTRWKIRQFRQRDGQAKWGSSRLTDAQADYYLLDGSELKSKWKPRGNGMHDIWIETAKHENPGKTIDLAYKTRYESNELLMTQDRKKRALVFYRREGSITAVIIQIDKPFALDSWSLSGVEMRHTDKYTQLIWLLSAAKETGCNLVWFRGALSEEQE